MAVKNYLGIDIGGTKIHAIQKSGDKIVWSSTFKTPKTNRAQFLLQIEKIILESTSNADILGIGIGVPSPVQPKGGKLCPANLPSLKGFDLKAYVEKRHKMPIRIANDAQCFVWGEYLHGAGKGHKNVVGLTLGTGIGGGWILDGKFYFGHTFSALEAGHMIINGEQEFEELGASKFLRKMARHDPLELQDMARQGDSEAQKVYISLGKNLAKGIANIINVINPEIIILGGGVANAHDLFLDTVKKEVVKYIISPFAKKTRIVLSKLRDHAGAMGAASLFEM
ncbi:MAG: ROK family protein [Candidatus Portnoybacteria bacterium]|nr:ROK family protein [Candidatus Portnoybacteria bacterium]